MCKHLRNSFFYYLSQYQEYFLSLLSMLAGLGVGVEEDVHVVALDSAAAVLCGVDDPADHDLASVRNLRRIYSDRMVCRRCHTC